MLKSYDFSTEHFFYDIKQFFRVKTGIRKKLVEDKKLKKNICEEKENGELSDTFCSVLETRKKYIFRVLNFFSYRSFSYIL